jgi:hypothetical protein
MDSHDEYSLRECAMSLNLLDSGGKHARAAYRPASAR